ncbi:unnamed protein product [Withania somnifera]
MVDYQDHHRVGTRTLWIKLNLSEEKDVLEDHNKQDRVHEDDVKEEDEVEIPENNRRIICHVCNKGFGSGKALGGHMRIHLLSRKKAKKSKLVVDRYYKKVDVQNYNKEDQLLLPICSVCGKNFPSMKSLFGHMRCHPERAWRGIQPPHWKSRDEIDRKTATVTVPGWSVTAKRGRKCNAEEATNSGSKEEEQLHDAVHHLMLLANGDSIESGLTGGSVGYDNKHDDIPEELEKTNINSLTSKAENEEYLAYHVSESNIFDNRKRRKKMKLKHLDSVQDSASPTATPPEKFKCSTCGKIFATHQALGGHKSSHNKFRMVIQNSDVTNIGATSEEAAASSSKLLAGQKNSPGEWSHTITGGRRILDFDLNQLPPDDHEDEPSGNHDYFPFFPI